MKRQDWNPGVRYWLKTRAGDGNYQYRKGKDNFTYLQYAFRNEDDATAFKITFG
jgi:hypothetical protein